LFGSSIAAEYIPKGAEAQCAARSGVNLIELNHYECETSLGMPNGTLITAARLKRVSSGRNDYAQD